METYVTAAIQILSAVAILICVAYSVVAVCTLNVYGRSKTVTLAMTVVYSLFLLALLGRAWFLLGPS